jgi:hypothetical protein
MIPTLMGTGLPFFCLSVYSCIRWLGWRRLGKNIKNNKSSYKIINDIFILVTFLACLLIIEVFPIRWFSKPEHRIPPVDTSIQATKYIETAVIHLL